jgi:hypothetical protein
MRWPLGSGHLRRRHGLNWLQHVQNQNLGILMPDRGFNSTDYILRKRRIVNCYVSVLSSPLA